MTMNRRQLIVSVLQFGRVVSANGKMRTPVSFTVNLERKHFEPLEHYSVSFYISFGKAIDTH